MDYLSTTTLFPCPQCIPWSKNIEGIYHGTHKIHGRYFDSCLCVFRPECDVETHSGLRKYKPIIRVLSAFPEKNLFILENMLYGNATYVFDNNWEEFSQLSKGEILNSGLLQERIVHREGWESSISRLFS